MCSTPTTELMTASSLKLLTSTQAPEPGTPTLAFVKRPVSFLFLTPKSMTKSVLFLAASTAFFVPAAIATPRAMATCNADKIQQAIASCDSLVKISQIKCDNRACHKALHVLVDPEYIACYEELKLGSKADLTTYKALDDFCHGEGPDPLEESGAVTQPNGNGTAAGSSDVEKKGESILTMPPNVPSPLPTPQTGSSGAITIACAATPIVLAVGLAFVV